MATVAERRAHVVWEGELRTGRGVINTGSGVLQGVPVTFPTRLESEADGTSPEELIAAAHATCYAMSLANALTSNGHAVEQLEVDAVCRLDRTDAGLVIKAMDLSARVKSPRLDAAELDDLARKAEQRCPVSNALRGNVEINLTTAVA